MSKLFINILRNYNSIPQSFQQIRWLPRWNHRRPVGVIPAEEYDKVNDVNVNKTEQESKMVNKIKWKQPRSDSLKLENEGINTKPLHFKIKSNAKPLSITKSSTKSKKEIVTTDMIQATIDSDGNFIYTKMGNNDSRIGSILVDVKSKKEKTKKDLILLEGKRLIKDALDVGCKLEYIIFSRMKEVEYLRPSLPKIGAKLYKMPYKEMQMWSDLTTNPGIMGIFKIPDTDSFTTANNSLPVTVICDNIREPSNLGAILRTCSGVGCHQVILTPGCVNVWDTKVLRSACGAHFKLQILKKLNWHGIREKIQPNSRLYVADNSTLTTVSDNDSDLQTLAKIIQEVPVLPYYGVDFKTANHVVLIIGGETEGISEESYKLVSEFKGVRLNVPLSNNVDSLNTATALGIIAFEVKRQLSSI